MPAELELESERATPQAVSWKGMGKVEATPLVEMVGQYPVGLGEENHSPEDLEVETAPMGKVVATPLVEAKGAGWVVSPVHLQALHSAIIN